MGLDPILERSVLEVFVLDPSDLRILEASRAAFRNLGYQREQLLGSPLTKIVSSDSRARYQELLEGLSSGSRTEARIVTNHIRQDGSAYPVESHLQLAAGTPARIIAVVFEITERKKAQSALDESRNLLRLVLDTIPVSVFWKDQDSTYLGCNQRFAHEAGKSDASDVIGKTDFDLAWSEEASRYQRDDASVLKTESPMLDYIEPFPVSNEEIRQVKTSKIPLRDKDGKIIGVLGVLDDITDRLRAEQESRQLNEQLAQSQKMEAIGQLAGGIAHDFNNLLTAILGNAEMMVRSIKMEKHTVEDLMHGLQQIHDAGKHASALTSQLLQFSRKKVMPAAPISPARALASIQELLGRVIRGDTELEVDIAESVSPILVDQSKMEQILMNLVLNACDALPDGGKIKISCGNAPSKNAEPSHVELTVEDNGAGIAEDAIDRVFEPFFTTKEFGKGSGLGLSIVYGIINEAGGKITVTSEAGKGARFHILLPCSEGLPVATNKESSESVYCTGNEVVLVCEDQRLVRKITTEILREAGYEVLAAENGQEAIDLINQTGLKIDLLVTDVIMPKLNGLQLADILMERFPDLGILYLSGYASDILDNQELHAFLQKPFEPDTLLSYVRSVLDQRGSES